MALFYFYHMTFAKHILDFYSQLKPDWKIPKGIELIYPFDSAETQSSMHTFHSKYFNDNKKRYFLFGINPGRLGAGVTGVPFTDPVFLESICGIQNPFQKKNELSSIFIYEMINALGGPEKFYSQFFISSLCPLGFTKDGKNYNYYDDKKLYMAVEKHMVKAIDLQQSHLCKHEKAFSIGQGKNFKVFKALNDKHKWFEEVIPLPHPRWVMQYRRKTKAKSIDEYVLKLRG